MNAFFQISIFLWIAIFSSCSSSSTVALKVNLGGDPSTLDPRQVRDLQSQTVAQMFFEGLMRFDKNEKPQCATAERVEVSSDGKIYTFYLRDSKWSNGDSVTAYDFVSTWKGSLEPKFPADRAFQLYVIKNAQLAKGGKISIDQVGISALDAKTLRVELDIQCPVF